MDAVVVVVGVAAGAMGWKPLNRQAVNPEVRKGVTPRLRMKGHSLNRPGWPMRPCKRTAP